MENINNIMKKCTKTGKKIQILLSTYNGQKYLRQQLDSFISLDNFNDVKVLIRDDGSKDGTLDILEYYEKEYGFQVIRGNNVGVNNSIIELIKYCDLSCDYYALSDQDDVWFPNKLIVSLEFLEKNISDKPVLFSSCSCITDENLNPIGQSVLPNKGVSFYNAMIQNICPGHTQVFNREMLLELKNNNSCDMFVLDYWIYLVASGIGKVIFMPECTVYHRQHLNNAVGYQVNPVKNLIARLKRLNFKRADKGTIQLKAFYDLYKRKLSKEYLEEIEKFLDCNEFITSRLKYVKQSKVYRQTKGETILFRILYILGKYHV